MCALYLHTHAFGTGEIAPQRCSTVELGVDEWAGRCQPSASAHQRYGEWQALLINVTQDGD